jgi:transcriptional regulator with XRE-family HTH domain
LDLNFTILCGRLLAFVNGRVKNGEFSERALARKLGISQPQLHNVLKGARKLTLETADLILSTLDIAFSDLLTEPEMISIAQRVGSLPTNSRPQSSFSLADSRPGRKPTATIGRTKVFADELAS